MRSRLLLAGLAVVVAATGSALFAGRVGVVRTSTGEVFEGDITERSDEVVVRAHGVDTVVTRDRITDIDYTSYTDRFNERLAALAKDDVDGRIALAREAFERHADPDALKAVASAIDIDPLNRDARQLETAISAQIQLEARTGAAASRPSTSTAGDDETRSKSNTFRRQKGLDDEQANRIRQLELSASDTVRVQFRNNVRKRFVDSQPGMSYRAFSARGDVDQAQAILARGTQEMRDDVIIRGDPNSIQSFGKHVQTALVQGCASSNCHGGTHAGDFRLMAGAPDPSTMITNFYLVTQYAEKVDSDDRGMFAPPSLPMVDRGNPRDSLVFQYALPRAKAKYKHPVVRGWDGLFRDDQDRLARDIIDWIDKDLARLRSDYGVTFSLDDPRGGTTEPTPATRPAAAIPATEPAGQ